MVTVLQKHVLPSHVLRRYFKGASFTPSLLSFWKLYHRLLWLQTRRRNSGDHLVLSDSPSFRTGWDRLAQFRDGLDIRVSVLRRTEMSCIADQHIWLYGPVVNRYHKGFCVRLQPQPGGLRCIFCPRLASHHHNIAWKIVWKGRIIQLMEISEICKALSRCYNCEMDIQVTVWLLSRSNHFHQFFPSSVNLCIVLPHPKITCTLNPFRNIRVPKEMVWDWPDIIIRGAPFQLKAS